MENLPNIDEIKEQNLVESESETDVADETEEGKEPAAEETQEEEQGEGETELGETPVQKRIDQLTYKYKSEREARMKLEEELRSSRVNPAQPTTEEAKKEQNAREYLRGLYKEIVAEEKAKEVEKDKALRSEIEHVSAIYPDFNEDKVLGVMSKYGITDVEKAYLAERQMKNEVEKVKQETKKNLQARPKSPSSVKTQDGVATKFSEKDITENSLWELAEKAKKEGGF